MVPPRPGKKKGGGPAARLPCASSGLALRLFLNERSQVDLRESLPVVGQLDARLRVAFDLDGFQVDGAVPEGIDVAQGLAGVFLFEGEAIVEMPHIELALAAVIPVGDLDEGHSAV